jgi:hypothetical protein
MKDFQFITNSTPAHIESLYQDFVNSKINCCEKIYIDVCNEFRIDWERLKLRYENGIFSQLTDTEGRHLRLDKHNKT